MDTSYRPHAKGVCPVPLWLDDKYFEWLMDILEGKVKVEPSVLSNIIECGRDRIRLTRAKQKELITKALNKTHKKTV